MDYAIAAGAVDIVDYLLGLPGIELDSSDLVNAASGISSFEKYDILAMQVSLSDPGEQILAGYRTQEVIFQNSPENYHAIFQKLLPRIDINAKNAEGMTPLIACTIANDYEGAKVLIDLGANAFLRYGNETALDIALRNVKTDPALVSLLRNAMK